MQALAELLRGTQIYLVSDEVYEHIIYDGRRHESALRYPELRERTFVISSFGKTYHCTGWKIGYAVAPPLLTAEFRKVHQYNTFTSFGPAQYGFAAIRDEPEHHLNCAFYRQARPFPRAADRHPPEGAAGPGRLLPAGRLLGHQRPCRTMSS